MDIIKIPNPILYQKATMVSKSDTSIKQLLRDMLDTMYENKGIGIAAPQVGISKRVCIVHYEDPLPIYMINPIILWKSEDTVTFEEGCLSIPGFKKEITRPNYVTVCYTTEKDEIKTRTVQGLLSSCMQHEIDHLDGKLINTFLKGAWWN